jgi:hypothetical protein
MGNITTARAWANNETAYIAWDIDGKIDECLGFEVTRVYINDDGTEHRVKCAAWVAFKGQRNSNWVPLDTGVWPVQKLNWRDLTLRKKRDGMIRRPDEVLVRYEIRPVGDFRTGLTPVTPNDREFTQVIKRSATGQPLLGSDGKPITERVMAYEGQRRPLAYLAPATVTNPVRITKRRGIFQSTFTNGILAAQWLKNVLNEDGVIEANELYEKIINPADPHRKYLAGDVIPLIQELFKRPGEFFLSLYELEDKELEDMLVANAGRIHIILSNTGCDDDKKWDSRNRAARKRLMDVGADIQHRMFNNSTHIGHNKFVVHVPPQGSPRAVLTGSTNWTSTGLAGQTNNALLVEEDVIAGVFLDYWTRMKADELKQPKPLHKEMKDNQQSKVFRASNASGIKQILGTGASVEVWFSPNRPERRKPASTTHPAPVPPDLAEIYRRMRMAKDLILFLAFYPGQSGQDCIIGEAIDIGTKDRSLLVAGAVSSPQAMPNYIAQKKGSEGGIEIKGQSPSTYDDGNISIVRAARIDDQTLLGDLGAEQLTARGGIGAIIHDKLVVIDPRSDDCTVVLGSHNLGYKASYSNDENLLIVTGDQDLAAAYAVHILDVYDHYRFRAIENERKRKGQKGWSGFLDTTDRWQNGYVDGRKGALTRYFARTS